MSAEAVQAIQDGMISAFQSQMQNVHTAMPCIVVGVRESLSGQMVDIQPSINQKAQDGTVAERPPILGVPVSFPVSSTAGMTFPIKAGDTGMAVFSMRGMDSWKAGNGRPSTPTTFAKMDKGDAVFYPGIQPPGSAVNNPSKHVLSHSTDDTVMFANLGATEAEVRIKADGSIEINTSNMPVTINCSVANINATEEVNLTTPVFNVDAQNTLWTGPITHIGNYTGTGVQTFNDVIFSSHRHAPSTVPPSN